MNRPLIPLLAALMLAACSGDSAAPDAGREPPPLAGARIGGPFTLVDETGRTVTDRDYAGRFRLVYFGYTFCPDVCPVDMQRLAAGLRELERRDPALAARLQPLFVTVDPERDTPEVVRQFTDAFHPRFVGLTGSRAQVDAAAERYAIFHRRGEGSSERDYLVDHSRQAYLMGPDGDPLALVPQDGTPAEIADTLQRWMR